MTFQSLLGAQGGVETSQARRRMMHQRFLPQWTCEAFREAVSVQQQPRKPCARWWTCSGSPWAVLDRVSQFE